MAKLSYGNRHKIYVGNGIYLSFENKDDILHRLEAAEEAGPRAERMVCKEFGRAGQRWVRNEVMKVYNVKRSEITPAKGSSKADLGTITASGTTVESAQIIYKGRMLTPVHFDMHPNSWPRGTAYDIYGTILKGGQKHLGAYRKTRTRGGHYSEKTGALFMGTSSARYGDVPFGRYSEKRSDIGGFGTVSLPEMVDSERHGVKPAIEKKRDKWVEEQMEKRIDHYIARALAGY